MVGVGNGLLWEGFLHGLKVLKRPIRVILTFKKAVPVSWGGGKRSISHTWGDMDDYSATRIRSEESQSRLCGFLTLSSWCIMRNLRCGRITIRYSVLLLFEMIFGRLGCFGGNRSQCFQGKQKVYLCGMIPVLQSTQNNHILMLFESRHP